MASFLHTLEPPHTHTHTHTHTHLHASHTTQKTGTLQFALQTAISVLLLTHWLHTAPSVQRAIDATVGSQKGYKVSHISQSVVGWGFGQTKGCA